tara:strand:- start:312 stop:755 length:444 start_codon:yes stop_codon:yes gene_type:complete
MTLPRFSNPRFQTEQGFLVIVQVPETHAQKIIDAVLAVNALKYGDYDRVTFRTVSGSQQFRSLGSGRNAATADVMTVPCVEVSFFLPEDEADAVEVLTQVYAAHPYEEPVVFVAQCLRTLHVRGTDEDNPNRFWNSEPEDWVPQEHR